MKYFFVLGTNTALSVAELAAVLDLKKGSLLTADFLIWETDTEINLENLMKRLGGTIKIGEIKDDNDVELLKTLTNLAKIKKYQSKEGKFNFGISNYGKFQFNTQNLGLKLKKYFSEENISSRFVISREKTLSSVVVTQNKLLTRGIEFVLIKVENKILIGETISVQPFKDLSRRDYGRPARDDQSGMLPPKVAQIMINLAQVNDFDDVIIDPFCGSGTILSEAMLAGYKHLFGSDLSAKAIDDTHKNISWIRELYNLKDVKIKILVKNVTNLSKFIKANSVEAIITEPFLGPQRGMINFKVVMSNLEELYSEAIKQFNIVLKTGGRVVMIWPMFYGQKPITPNHTGFKMLNMLPEDLRESEFIKKSYRPTIIYGRPGQKVYREIVVLEKE
jgi:tRNA G10  N-methylase Trm11